MAVYFGIKGNHYIATNNKNKIQCISLNLEVWLPQISGQGQICKSGQYTI